MGKLAIRLVSSGRQLVVDVLRRVRVGKLAVRLTIGVAALLAIALGAAPVLGFIQDIADPADVLFVGRVVDPAGLGVPARVIVLRPGVSADLWGGDAERIAAIAVADADGRFRTEGGLRRGEVHDLIVEHERFATMAAVNVPVGNGAHQEVDLGTFTMRASASP
ncbi:MAG: hypothetical protein EPO26_17070 [Chloroflexota bacterium]|nr:MAG: hypothetical protein EPO26_17070 [Chloroflexota bacterium]